MQSVANFFKKSFVLLFQTFIILKKLQLVRKILFKPLLFWYHIYYCFD